MMEYWTDESGLHGSEYSRHSISLGAGYDVFGVPKPSAFPAAFFSKRRTPVARE
jgi:hypothetical protein